jgi:hypothetical protein
MELMRQLEFENLKTWERRQAPNTIMITDKDCDPALLNGWADRDISLWDVSETDNKPGMQRILVALCKTKKQTWEKIGYLVFPSEAVNSVGLTLTPSNGSTGNPQIDCSQTHFEIKEITGKKLCSLVYAVVSSDLKTGVFTKKDLDNLLYKAYESSQIRTMAKNMTGQYPATLNLSSGTQPAQTIRHNANDISLESSTKKVQSAGASQTTVIGDKLNEPTSSSS